MRSADVLLRRLRRPPASSRLLRASARWESARAELGDAREARTLLIITRATRAA